MIADTPYSKDAFEAAVARMSSNPASLTPDDFAQPGVVDQRLATEAREALVSSCVQESWAMQSAGRAATEPCLKLPATDKVVVCPPDGAWSPASGGTKAEA